MGVKAYKATVYILDLNNNLGEGSPENIETTLEYGDAEFITVTEVIEADIGEWDDKHPLNYGRKSPWDKFFPPKNS